MALHKGLRIAVAFGIFIAALTGIHHAALAACTSPAGIAGGITWNGTDSVIWCDGTNWYTLKNGGASGSNGILQVSNGSGGFSASNLFWDSSNYRVGFITTTPSYSLSFGGEGSRSLGVERESNDAGRDLTITAGGAPASTADLGGGNLFLSSGIATGTGSSNIYFRTATAGSTGTADVTPNTKMTILGNGNVGIGTVSPRYSLHVGASSGTLGTYNGNGTTTFTPQIVAQPTSGVAGVGAFVNNNTNNRAAALFMNDTDTLWGLSQANSSGGAVPFVIRQHSTGEVLRIDSAGNIGIGTTSPSYLLSLSGEAARTVGMERTSAGTNGYGLTIRAGGAVSGGTDRNGGNLTLASGTATGTGSSNIYFQTATPQATTNTTDNTPTTSMTILGNGNVGIGMSSPAYRLQLFDSQNGGEATLLQLHNRGGSNGTAAGIAFSPSMDPGTGLRIVGTQFGNSDGRFQFYTNGPDGSVQRMILHSWGLGIGPASSNFTGQIHLNGAKSVSAWNQYGTGLVLAGGPYTDTTSSGTVAQNHIHAVYGSTLAATNATTYTRAANFVVGPVTAGTNVTITNPLSFVVNSGKSAFWGNVGINTDSPSNQLEVFAVSNSRAKLKTFTNTAANRSAVLLARSRSTTLGTAQHVLSGDAIGSFFGVSDNGGTESWVGMSVVATQDHTDTAHGMALTFSTTANDSVSAPERMRIDQNGNVGIGTDTPSYLLSLGGEAARTIGMERTSAGTNGYGLTIQAGGAKSGTADLNGGDLLFLAGTATGSGTSNIYFRAAGGGTAGTADRVPSTAMTILGNGNVGIGNSMQTPTSLLQVGGTAARSSSFNHLGRAVISANDDIAAVAALTLRNTFNGGYGVGLKFELGYGGSANGVGTSFVAAAINAIPEQAWTSTASTQDSALAFGVMLNGNGLEAVRIASSGNVGIGTTTPAAKLDVNGFMRLAKNGSAPATCDATIDGAIALTSQYTLCACKGGSSAWVTTTDGTTACAW